MQRLNKKAIKTEKKQSILVKHTPFKKPQRKHKKITPIPSTRKEMES